MAIVLNADALLPVRAIIQVQISVRDEDVPCASVGLQSTWLDTQTGNELHRFLKGEHDGNV